MTDNDYTYQQEIEDKLEQVSKKAAAFNPHPPEMEEVLRTDKARRAALKADKCLPVITAGQLVNKELPPAEVLLSPWLKRGTLALVAAPAGVGKTWVALTLTQALATGSEAFGRWEAPKPRRVLFLDGEMSLQAMQERLKMLQADKAGDNVILYNPDLDPDSPSVNIADAEGQQRIMNTIKEYNVDVVVVDNVAALYRNGENSNSAESWGVMQEFLLKLRREKLGVLVIDHIGKSKDANSARGTSAKSDVLDFALMLRRPDGYQQENGAQFVVEFTKNRGLYGDDVRAFVAALDPITGQWNTEDYSAPCNTAGRPKNDANYHAVVEAFNAGITSPKEISEQTGVPLRSVNTYLKNIRTGWADADGYHVDDFGDYQ